MLQPSWRQLHFPWTAKLVQEHLTQSLSETQGIWNRLLFWQAAQIATDAVKNTLRFAASRFYFQLLMILSNCTTFFLPLNLSILSWFSLETSTQNMMFKKGLKLNINIFHIAALAISHAAAYPWCLERWLPCAVTKKTSDSWWSQRPLKNTIHSSRI